VSDNLQLVRKTYHEGFLYKMVDKNQDYQQINESNEANNTNDNTSSSSRAIQVCKVQYEAISLNFSSDGVLDRDFYRFRDFVLEYVVKPEPIEKMLEALSIWYSTKITMVECVRAMLAVPEIEMMCDTKSLVVAPRTQSRRGDNDWGSFERQPNIPYNNTKNQYSISYVPQVGQISMEMAHLVVLATRTLRGLSEVLPVVRYLFYRSSINNRVLFAYCDDKGQQKSRKESKYLTCKIIADRIAQPLTFFVPIIGEETQQLEMTRLIYLMHTNLIWCAYESGKNIMKLAFPSDEYALYYAWDREITGYKGHSRVMPPMGYMMGVVKETQFTLPQDVVYTILVTEPSEVVIRNDEFYSLGVEVFNSGQIQATPYMAANTKVSFLVSPGLLNFRVVTPEHHRLRGLRVIMRTNPHGLKWGPEVHWTRIFHIVV